MSPNMLLEHTYNADAEESSGFEGLTLKPAAPTKWITTKIITASVSTRSHAMLHLSFAPINRYHDSGYSKGQRDIDLVTSVLATVEENPFLD